MFLWVIALPVTFNWMSPVLVIMGGFDGYISLSLIFFIGWFLSSLVFGRAYCSHVCQWGACQEILGDAIPKKLDPSKKNKRRKIKYPIFVIWVLFIALGPIMTMGYINGFNPYYPNASDEVTGLISFSGEVHFMQLILYFGIIGSVAILFVLVGGKRSFCNYACPMAVMGIIGTKIKNALKYPSLHLEADVDKCTQCKQCSKACEMSLDVHELVKSGNLYDPDCILCGNCIIACPQDVIDFAWKWPKKQ